MTSKKRLSLQRVGIAVKNEDRVVSRRYLLISICLIMKVLCFDHKLAGADQFASYTMRVDFLQIPEESGLHIAIRGIRKEGPWAGPMKLDKYAIDLGECKFTVRDSKSKLTLFSNGYSCNDYQFTSIRFPYPERRVLLSIFRRTELSPRFNSIFTAGIDPNGVEIDRSPLQADIETMQILKNGPTDKKLDLAILGDGYTLNQKAKFFIDAKQAAVRLGQGP